MNDALNKRSLSKTTTKKTTKDKHMKTVNINEINAVVTKLANGKVSGEITLDAICKELKNLDRQSIYQALKSNPAYSVTIGRRQSPTRIQYGMPKSAPVTNPSVRSSHATEYFLEVAIGNKVQRLPISVNLVAA